MLIHFANVLYVGSYLVKDILWLRLLTVVAGLTLLAYYALLPIPLWAAVGWNVVFTLINGWQIRLLVLERRPVRLEPEELALYRLSFRGLTLREFAKVIKLARWENVAAGTKIATQGEALDHVRVIAKGRAVVEVAGARKADLPAGCFVGEMSFLTGGRANADVIAVEPLRLASWPQAELRAVLAKNPELRAAVQAVIGEDLIAKLRPS